VRVGNLQPLRYSLISVQECSFATTACKEGVANVAANIVIQKAEANEVTLSIDLLSDVRRSQTVDNGVRVSRSILSAAVPAEFKAIEGTQRSIKTATVPMGQFRRVRLDHSVSLDVCAEPQTAPVMLERKCDIELIQSGAIAQSSLPDLRSNRSACV